MQGPYRTRTAYILESVLSGKNIPLTDSFYNNLFSLTGE